MSYATAYKPDCEALDQFICRKGGINEFAARFSRGRRKANIERGPVFQKSFDDVGCQCPWLLSAVPAEPTSVRDWWEKIECSFKQAVRQIGSFSYHFWMKDMIPLRYHNGNQYLHRKSPDYRNRVKRKMRAYHAFIQAGMVAQGLLQYLAIGAPKLVWSSFGSWLRTIGWVSSTLRVARGIWRPPGHLRGLAASDIDSGLRAFAPVPKPRRRRSVPATAAQMAE
jgi:hypothetical protein